MTTSGGRHEIAAAKQRLEAAKVQASSAEGNLESAKAIEENAQAMMESAKAMLVRAKKARESAQAQVDFSQKEVEQAEECLEMSEKRWAVIDIDSDGDDDDEYCEVVDSRSKKLKVQPAGDVVIAADDEDEENVSPNVIGFGISSEIVGAGNPSDLGAVVVSNCGLVQVNGTYKRSGYINDVPSFRRKGMWTRMARDAAHYVLLYRENYWYIEIHDAGMGVSTLYRTRNPISSELLPGNDWITFSDHPIPDLGDDPGPTLIF